MNSISIPLSIQIVIDDVGWWTGKDGSKENGPFRTGIARDHHPADYEAIAELGKRLGMRPQAAFIISEWDRTDRLRSLPDATHRGERWSNPWKSSPLLDEAAKILRNESRHIELALHGLGHEYWGSGAMDRAEWHDGNGRMRPEGSVTGHLDAFAALLEENDLGPFPESFVPTAFYHRFGGEGGGLSGILERYGIKYMSTPFSMMHRSKRPESELFGVDGSLITVNRGDDLCGWNRIAPDPRGEIEGPVCGMHWPNVLHPDPEKNGDVVRRWVDLLEPYRQRFDTMLAANTAEGFSQLIYRWGVALREEPSGCVLDFSGLSGCRPPGLLDYFTIKVKRDKHIVSSSSEISLFENASLSTPEYRTVVVKRRGSENSALIRMANGGEP
ncbi:hypothetical protein I8J29_29620 [Paenibacillus sp. MWE-103]|uniref:DUF2334 domain-containing protein n=1 Tax=Paenibacillus artemisiicola TaxID=1172618 RepID=A0ABS3WJ67_9BACL|nr:hypothetical protein [Paenibacillus artemisiicola]MBO7748352.1 hypothetical protein [Paenibacillus artemisiicola]